VGVLWQLSQQPSVVLGQSSSSHRCLHFRA